MVSLVMRHLAFEDLGSLSQILTYEGYSVNELDVTTMGPWGLDPGSPDLAVVLGGPVGVYEQDKYPFLAQELAWLRDRLEKERPTLGICLGAQLMAAAMGGEVMPGPVKEIGFGPLTLTEAGRESVLAPLGEENAVVLHWHGDTFTLPEGAVCLASNEHYENQAFAIGDFAMGFQFHLEVTQAGFERWLVGHACEISHTGGVEVNALRDAMALHAAGLRDRCTRVIKTWLRQLPE